MAEVDFQPERPRELLGVYRDAAAAQRVLDQVQQKLHSSEGRVGHGDDEVDSLRAEMREKTEHPLVTPQAALVTTKESAKGMAFIMPIALVFGILFMLPFVFFFAENVNLGTRLAAGIGVGAAVGGTMGFVLSSLTAKRPNEKMAAERGVTVRVTTDREDVRATMIEGHPIRLDVIDDAGRPVETIATEDAQSDEGTAQNLGKRVNQWP